MGSGGSKEPPTQTTQYQASPEEREIMNLGLPGVRAFAAQGVPEQYPGSTTLPFNAYQTAGQAMALDAASRQAGVAGSAAGATERWLNSMPDAGRMAAAEAIARPVYENLTETVFPGIRSQAAGAGQYGGTRQGIAEGLAAKGSAQAAADAIAKIQPELYSTDVKAQLQALGLAPQTAQGLLSPAVTTAGVGDVQAQKEQEALTEQINRFYYPQYAGLAQSRDILSILSALPRTGQNVATGSIAPNTTPTWQRSLASAGTLGSLGSAFGPVGTVAGAGIGATLPFLLG